MFQQLINHSPDLQKLRNDGYELQKNGGYLCIHHIPYLNSDKELKYGSLVTQLDTDAKSLKTVKPHNHVIYFIGEAPCHQNGSTMKALINQTANSMLLEGLTVNHTFSSRPADGYSDFYQKVTTYVELISAPARSVNPEVTACTFNIIPDEEESSVFNYYDTNSSRANIELLNNKLRGQKIAIIGIGGTGGYLLDLLSKTPVSEIHMFDGDNFLQHNSFRAPGAASVDCFGDDKKSKVNYFADIYSNMHKGIFRHSYYLTEDNLHELDAFTFVFICVDKSKVRKMVIEYLLIKEIAFIDVGLGVNVIDGAITGLIRTTLGTPQKFDHLDKRIPGNDDDNDDYHTNVQIAELNMYNAVQAVMKWKKFLGFYHDTLHEHDSCFIIDQSKIINEDTET